MIIITFMTCLNQFDGKKTEGILSEFWRYRKFRQVRLLVTQKINVFN